MSTVDFTPDPWWGGRQVARRCADAAPRARVVVTATVTGTEITDIHGAPSLSCTMDDGSGTLVAVFLGRSRVAGFEVGAHCTIEGTVQAGHPVPTVWNPLYRIEAPDGPT